jgi:hypothetical protein
MSTHVTVFAGWSAFGLSRPTLVRRLDVESVAVLDPADFMEVAEVDQRGAYRALPDGPRRGTPDEPLVAVRHVTMRGDHALASTFVGRGTLDEWEALLCR